jgi:hypothetical protein
MEDYGDLADLRARLEFFAESAAGRLVPIVGSGLSSSVLPNVNGLTDRFRDVLGVSGRRRFDEVIGPISGTPLAYQNAAALLKRQAGDAAVARVVRGAVLEACESVTADSRELAKDVEACAGLEKSASWKIPVGYKGLARFYASLDGDKRGPIITTNFDPLLEIALREAGVPAVSVPIPLDSAPTVEQLRQQDAVPVLHIHGFWTSSTLNTITQLTKPRPALAGMLRHVIQGSVLLVLGYSGWEDAFMRSLAERIAEADLLGAEVLWAAYGVRPEDSLVNATLERLDGVPGFTLYLAIDGHALFTDSLERTEGDISLTESPFGYTRLPVRATPRYVPLLFVEGGQPSWDDALPEQWPMLRATHSLFEGLATRLGRGGGGGVVAIGPIGEGKSLAIRQVATRVGREMKEWTVLWRDQGAPPITEHWLEEIRSKYGKVLVCIDEADLVGHELVACASTWRDEGSGVAFLLASHDRLWWRHGLALKGFVEDVLFHGLDAEDAGSIVDAWARHGLLPSGNDGFGDTSSVYSDRLRASSNALVDTQEGTLFGAILDVRHGEGLTDRISDLIRRLDRVQIRPESDVTLAQVFGGICLMQDTYDKYGGLRKGASRSLIAAMVGLPSIFADGKILEYLGREAAIAFAGDRVYSRHPAIARNVIDYLRGRGDLEMVCHLVAKAGGTLRDSGVLDEAEYHNAYMLTRSLAIQREAISAAQGSVEGAPGLLEPRVSLVSTLRRFDSEQAARYASALGEHLTEYRDYGASVRAYLNERSLVARKEGVPYAAMGFASLGLHDGMGFTLDNRRASYLLTSFIKSALTVRNQNPTMAGRAPEMAYVMLERVIGSEATKQHLSGASRGLLDLPEVRQQSPEVTCQRLGPFMSMAARQAFKEHALSFAFEGTVGLSDLLRLARPQSRRR